MIFFFFLSLTFILALTEICSTSLHVHETHLWLFYAFILSITQYNTPVQSVSQYRVSEVLVNVCWASSQNSAEHWNFWQLASFSCVTHLTLLIYLCSLMRRKPQEVLKSYYRFACLWHNCINIYFKLTCTHTQTHKHTHLQVISCFQLFIRGSPPPHLQIIFFLFIAFINHTLPHLRGFLEVEFATWQNKPKALATFTFVSILVFFIKSLFAVIVFFGFFFFFWCFCSCNMCCDVEQALVLTE